MLCCVSIRPTIPAVLLLSGLALGTWSVRAAGPVSADFAKDEKKFPNAGYPLEFRNRVAESIVRSSNWLLKRQKDDGSFMARAGAGGYPLGPTALATLALLKAGIPAGHPRLEKAFGYMRQQKLERTYEVAVLLMCLDAKYDGAHDGFAVELVDRYGQRVVSDPCAAQISKEDLAWMKQGVDFLVKNQTSGYWRYPSGGFDLSNTQYALLGLKAADRCGLTVPTAVWKSALDFLLGFQAADGIPVDVRANEVRGEYRIEWTEKAKARGFCYTNGMKGEMATGSMTTAGAAGLMICQSMLWKSRKFTADDRDRTRTAVRDAVAWMQTNFDVTTNPRGQDAWHYYYLYGLERMGIVGHLRFLGKIDWYLEGAEFLLREQDDTGSWHSGDIVQTCFALLFLKRSSFKTSNPVITPSDPDPVKAPDQRDSPPPAMGESPAAMDGTSK